MEQILRYVSNGAQLLDRIMPDWFTKINCANLDISSDCQCVLGQLFGLYVVGRDILHFDVYASRDHGFTLLRDHWPVPATFEDLNAAWRDEIGKRRVASLQYAEAVSA